MKLNIRKIIGTVLIAGCWLLGNSASANLSCPTENQINVQFDNGAAWQMCWDSRIRENIVLSEVHYQPVNTEPYSVFNSLRLSQLHVTYDDSNVTYNDVTQFGLGAGYISTLTEADCPGGTLANIGGRAGMCTLLSTGDDTYTTANETRKSQSLSVFSVSQVGAYAYLITWKFFADGSVEPSVGAAGALQRSSDDEASPFGRKLEGVPEKSWLSHTHNYYWQLDFDLGTEATDDIVSELNFITDTDGRRSRQRQTFTIEAARAIEPANMRAWIINDLAATDTAPGYLIEPVNHGHTHVNTPVNEFTEYDFFVTKQKDCERFVSENAKFNPDCDENILQFVDNESIENEDVVLWHRVSFHHVPRNEDRHVMHSHWDGFVMEARNLNQQTPGHSGAIAEATTTALAAVEETSALAVSSSDSSFGCSLSPKSNPIQKTDLMLLVLGVLALRLGRRYLHIAAAMHADNATYQAKSTIVPSFEDCCADIPMRTARQPSTRVTSGFCSPRTVRRKP